MSESTTGDFYNSTGGVYNAPVPQEQHPCPNCGYCPHCGRGGHGYYQHLYSPPYYTRSYRTADLNGAYSPKVVYTT